MGLLQKLTQIFTSTDGQNLPRAPIDPPNRSPRVLENELSDDIIFLFRPENKNWNPKGEALEFDVDNLSLTGLGLYVEEEELKFFPAGSFIKGDVSIGKESFPIRMEVIHQTKNLIGIRYLDPFSPFVERLRAAFGSILNDIEVACIDMEKFDLKIDGEPHWYYGGPDYELFYVLNKEGLVSQFNMNIFGDFIQHCDTNKLRYHMVNVDLENDEIVYELALKNTGESRIPYNTFENAKKFLANLQQADENAKNSILKTIELAMSNAP